MKQLDSEIQDIDTLQDLGRASVQIVHDLKNQLNGLKLYATFLRKRFEKDDRPEDERETIGKLISGLERAATDLNTLVRYGRPVALQKRPNVPLDKVFSSLANDASSAADVRLEIDDVAMQGEFDSQALSEALQSITKGAIGMRSNGEPIAISVRRSEEDQSAHAVIEWHGVRTTDDDVFRSFAGSDALRMSLAARIIEAHSGTIQQRANAFLARLPINNSKGS
jgi:light-regulated signal transduction histidine kinase (bacteriophytochrome)